MKPFFTTTLVSVKNSLLLKTQVMSARKKSFHYILHESNLIQIIAFSKTKSKEKNEKKLLNQDGLAKSRRMMAQEDTF